MGHQPPERMASLARCENEGGATRPHLRLIRRLPLRSFNKFNMWNFGGFVDDDDAASSPSVRQLPTQVPRRGRPQLVARPLAAAGRFKLGVKKL